MNQSPSSYRHASLPAEGDVRRPAPKKSGSARHDAGLVTSPTTPRSVGGLRSFNQFLRKRGVAISIWCVLLLAMAFQMPRFRNSKSTKETARTSQRVTKSTSTPVATNTPAATLTQ